MNRRVYNRIRRLRQINANYAPKLSSSFSLRNTIEVQQQRVLINNLWIQVRTCFFFLSPRPDECVIGSYFFVSFYFYIFQGANLLRPLLNPTTVIRHSRYLEPVLYKPHQSTIFEKSKKKQKNTKPEELIQHFFQCVKGALPLIQQLHHHRIYTRPVVR
jgi:hypothetical protein